MIAALGTAGALAAAAASVGLAARGIAGAVGERAVAIDRLRLYVVTMVVGALVSMAALEVALLSDDFSIVYTANHHLSTTPLLFTIATAWAALEGSIVLWALILAGFTWAVYRYSRRRPDRLSVGTLGVLGLVGVFFFALILTVANPFEVCVAAGPASCLESSILPWASGQAPLDGTGPNPLLQNHVLMAIHPPILYLGYVGMAVPFAYAISALIIGRSGRAWLQRTRNWALVAWIFLTAGILLGGLWSYEVLGWGGYWAWDPVENASFLPWLVATAFMHSAVVQARRGVLRVWNFVLVIGAFSLTILGTFLTRSGIVASVHSFTQSLIGPALLGFLMVVVIGSLALVAARADLVASPPRLDSLASREGVFLLNNLLLTVFAFVVLTGTLYPLLVEAFSGAQVGVGRPFFDRFAIPLSFALLLTMGVGPITPYRVARGAVIWDRLRAPVRVALMVGALAVLLGLRRGLAVVALVLGVFVIAILIRLLWATGRQRRRRRPTPSRLWTVLRSDPHFWGGQIAHVGVALLAIAIAMSGSFSQTEVVDLASGQSVQFAGFELTYDGPFIREESHRSVVTAVVLVDRQGSRSVLEPSLNRYLSQAQPVVTPGVRSSLRGDLYLSPRFIGPDQVVMEVSWFPLMSLVWVGGALVAMGGVFSLVGGGLRRRAGARRRPAESQAPVSV